MYNGTRSGQGNDNLVASLQHYLMHLGGEALIRIKLIVSIIFPIDGTFNYFWIFKSP